MGPMPCRIHGHVHRLPDGQPHACREDPSVNLPDQAYNDMAWIGRSCRYRAHLWEACDAEDCLFKVVPPHTVYERAGQP